MKQLYTLAAVMLGGLVAQAQVAVTFQVDMNQQVVDPNGVHVAGNFQAAAGFAGDWDPSTTALTDANSDGVYEVTVTIPTGTYEYKFVNGNGWGGAESVPGGCNTNGNRQIVVTAAATTPDVCFSSCAPCPAGPIPTYQVTFQVDMQNVCNYDSVDVAGTINGWAGGDKLTDPDSDGIYTVTMTVDSGDIEYKFRSFFQGNTGWEGVANRMATISGNTTIPLVCFNGTAPCTPKPADAPVTFVVDMTNAGSVGDTIWVIGDFTLPAWQAGRIVLDPIPNQPGLFGATVTMCPGSFFYKFVNGRDGQGNWVEEGFPTDQSCVTPNGVGGFNRSYTRTNAGAVILSFEFDSCAAFNFVGTEEFSTRSFNVYPNPMTSKAVVELGTDASYDVTLVDLRGQVVRRYGKVNGNLEVAREGLVSGLYLVKIENAAGQINTQRILVQ
jgi:hypothetical protein